MTLLGARHQLSLVNVAGDADDLDPMHFELVGEASGGCLLILEEEDQDRSSPMLSLLRSLFDGWPRSQIQYWPHVKGRPNRRY